MHELSIAMSIVEICTEEAKKAKAEKVTRVELEVGSLSGIEPDALEFSWDVAVKDSPVDGASLIIHKIDASARCNDCEKEFEIDNIYDPCPYCGNFSFEISKGKELLIRKLMVE